jgi:hypothetical protein
MAEDIPLSYHLLQLKTELQDFINTRYELLSAELKESGSKVASAAVKIGAGAALALVGMILLATCVSIWFATFFGTAFQDQYGLIWGFLIIGGFLVIVGGALAGAGAKKLKTKELIPSRTVRVLKRYQQIIEQQGDQYGDEPPIRRGA